MYEYVQDYPLALNGMGDAPQPIPAGSTTTPVPARVGTSPVMPVHPTGNPQPQGGAIASGAMDLHHRTSRGWVDLIDAHLPPGYKIEDQMIQSVPNYVLYAGVFVFGSMLLKKVLFKKKGR